MRSSASGRPSFSLGLVAGCCWLVACCLLLLTSYCLVLGPQTAWAPLFCRLFCSTKFPPLTVTHVRGNSQARVSSRASSAGAPSASAGKPARCRCCFGAPLLCSGTLLLVARPSRAAQQPSSNQAGSTRALMRPNVAQKTRSHRHTQAARGARQQLGPAVRAHCQPCALFLLASLNTGQLGKSAAGSLTWKQARVRSLLACCAGRLLLVRVCVAPRGRHGAVLAARDWDSWGLLGARPSAQERA